ncbi:hypothetical protein JTB14_003926 [Gonioctena quinquepunctata]|nr:hypothetical protein JTB14_003926 [Gonioctena quinquepunctata]
MQNYLKHFSKNLACNGVPRIFNRIKFFSTNKFGIQESVTSEQKSDKQKRFQLTLLTNTLNSVNFNDISREDGKLLLASCGNSTADSSRESRNEMCQKIYHNLSKHDKLDFSIYHSYIRICTENGVCLNSKDFLSSLKHKPDELIYKLLLENICESGKVGEAFILLEVIKSEGYSVDEDVFASLLLAHTIEGGLKAAESVLLTMKTAHVPETLNTKLALLKGVLRRNDYDDFTKILDKYPVELDENQLLSVLQELGLYGNVSWLAELNVLFGTWTISREFINNLKNTCTHLVHMNKSKNALTIFEYFVPSGTEENFGFFIGEEMLHSNIITDEIISLARYLQDNEMNPYIFVRLTEVALKNQYVDAAWRLLENFTELRPHYFWPLMAHAHETNGEIGVLNVIARMINMKIKPDAETLELFVLPFCNLADAKVAVQKIENLGLTIREILSSALLVLLKNKRAKDAAALCDFYKVEIRGEKLFRLISSSWHSTRDSESAAMILQKYYESCTVENDLVGDFLVSCLNYCKNSDDFNSFASLLKILKKRKLKLTTTSADILYNTLSKSENDTSQNIRMLIDDMLDLRIKPETSYIPHPRNMTEDELECHLLELQEKNMETRGVLRKLIQLHSRFGNSKRVEQLRQIFQEAGYVETAGMKSSVMHSYITGGHTELALDMYKEIKEIEPTFSLDNYKIIDLATLLVGGDRFAEAIEMFRSEGQSRVIGGPAIQRNCTDLLKVFKDEQEQLTMFEFLIDKGYCKVNNVVLGPLVRIHLNSGNLEKAVSTYIDLSKRYRCTPLQLEVIRELVKMENEPSLQAVLNATSAVHGPVSTQVALITALAEIGQEKALRKILSTVRMPLRSTLEKRCERWIMEKKVAALQTLADCCDRLPKEVIDVNFIYNCIMKIHNSNNNCEAALELYERLIEKELPVHRELEEIILKLLKHNNYVIPKSLQTGTR